MASITRRLRGATRGNPLFVMRVAVAAGAAVIGAYWLASGRDTALGGAIVAFAAYVALALAFDLVVFAYVDQSAVGSDVVGELVTNTQAAVLALTGTTLGLLAAFTEGELPVAIKAAVVSLVAAALVQYCVQASGARHLGGTAWQIGAAGDLVAMWFLSFGLISLAAALVTQGDP